MPPPSLRLHLAHLFFVLSGLLSRLHKPGKHCRMGLHSSTFHGIKIRTHTATHEMRLTLDKVFGTCLEFHPSQFYNRMKHKAGTERKNSTSPIFFCNWQSCFCFYIILFVPADADAFSRNILAVIIACSYGLTTSAAAATTIRIHLFSQREMCPFNIDFTYHIQMRSLLSGMNNEKLCLLLCLPTRTHTHWLHFAGNFIVHRTHTE